MRGSVSQDTPISPMPLESVGDAAARPFAVRNGQSYAAITRPRAL